MRGNTKVLVIPWYLAVRGMPENEVIYRTNLDLRKTIERLTSIEGAQHMQVRYELGMAPSGIAHIKWRSISCNIGANGGVQIHYDLAEDHDSFLDLLRSKAVYRNNEDPKWAKKKERLGRTFYKDITDELLEAYDEAAQDLEDLTSMPGRDRTDSIEDRIRYLAASFTRVTYHTALVEGLKRIFRPILADSERSSEKQ